MIIVGKPGMHSFIAFQEEPCWGWTASTSIYEILLTVDGQRTKRGKTKVRVRGLSSQWAEINKMAEKIAKRLDTGTYSGPKLVTIKVIKKEQEN